MPIYDQTYRSYDGVVRRSLRWWTMVKQELRILFSTRPFVYLLIFAIIHFCFRLFQIIAYDMLSSNPNNPLTAMMRGVAMFDVTPSTFLDFLRIQSTLVFLVSLYAGSGMICNDFQDNLMEIYFSKPLSRRDYLLGKLMTLVVIGLFLTAIPAIVLVILHNLLAPGWETLGETYWLPISITAFSLVLILPCALGVLASSALFKSQRFAGIGVFMLLFADLSLGVLLHELLHNRNYQIVAFPLAINRIGESLFGLRQFLFDLHWGWSLGYVAAVCLVCHAIVSRRVKQAERAA